MTKRTELENAIAVLEAQRSILGDAVVDAAISPMREQLSAQGRQEAGSTLSPAAERKLITILFADVVGSTALAEELGGEMARLILDRCLRRVSEAVDEFGGTVSSLMGDGLMAFFGVPQAYEDDPERAVLAAARMHETIARYAGELGRDLAVRVGINTGRVVLGDMGGEVHAEYTAMGPPVNLAARLQSAAGPGKTLLGESTARMIRYRFQIDPVEPLNLKGFTDPVSAYEPLGGLAQAAPPSGLAGLLSPLVGRDNEMARLAEKIADIEDGLGGIVALIGEPGIGKSRLLQEIRAASHGKRLRFGEGRAYSYTQEQPFSVIRDLLAELMDLTPDDSPAILDLKLEGILSSHFAEDLETVWPFLATLLRAPVPSQYAHVLDGLDPEAVNARMIQAVQLLIQKTAEQRPLVLSFEDLHWADRHSLRLIETLLLDTERSALLLLLLFRPDRDKRVWQLKLTAETYFAHRYLELPLRPLDGDATIQMIENLLQVVNFPENVRYMIGERAQGNPLYVEELLRSLIEGGVLIRDGNAWQIHGQMTALSVPETLEKVIQARFDRLPRAERIALQAASVIGRRFSYRLLKGMFSTDDDLRHQLFHLQQMGMIHERSRLPEVEYVFKHVIVQEVIYHTLLSEQRRELHHRAAELLETLFPEQRDELAATLAEHYAAAGENRMGLDSFVLAAKHGKEIYAYEEALYSLQRAKELGDLVSMPPEERINLLERLADMHYLLREALEAIDFYEEALDLWQSLDDGDKWTAVRLYRKIVEAWWIMPTIEDEKRLEVQAAEYLMAGLRLTVGEDPHLATVPLLIMAARFTRHARDYLRPLFDDEWQEEDAYAHEAIKMAEQLDAPVELSAALHVLAENYNRREQIRDYVQVEQQRQILIRDKRVVDQREKMNILFDVGWAFKLTGDYAQAIPLLLECETIAAQIKDTYEQSGTLAAQGECWIRLDRWDEVLLAAEKMQALQQSYPAQRLRPTCWLLGYKAAVLALRGEEAVAARLADESYALMLERTTEKDAGEEQWNKAHFY